MDASPRLFSRGACFTAALSKPTTGYAQGLSFCRSLNGSGAVLRDRNQAKALIRMLIVGSFRSRMSVRTYVCL